MFQIGTLSRRSICSYSQPASLRGLRVIMTVNTVTTDPRISARHPHQQQALSTAQSREASGNDYYRPRSKGNPPESRSNGTDNDSAEPRVYVLTLLTDSEHHKCMTALRRRYFPPKLNKLESHITLFHALPEEKLDHDIIPEIETRVSQTKPYRIQATGASRLNKGVAIDVADDIDHAQRNRNNDKPRGRNMTRIIHAELRKKWSAWLSEQDSRPPKIHYTVMNKVNEQGTCDNAMKQVNEMIEQGSMPSSLLQADGHKRAELDESDRVPLKVVGDVLGLTLWRYEKSGHWVEPRHFEFLK